MQGRLFKLLWLSVAAAIVTIALKATAWLITGSVGLLSDAAESVVNLVAAVVAILALRWALKPADEEHAYGHAKAEYFSAGVEGAMIVAAALVIVATALPRLWDPQPIEEARVGMAISAGASLINLGVGVLLLRAGRQERSIVLEADGRHLLTDVWTTAGVVAAVGLVALTGWNVIDPLVALAVAGNIIITGTSLMRRSVGGLMDQGLNTADQARIADVLARYERDGIGFHALRTRQAGSRAFISLHVLVPGAWTVQRGHDVVEDIERDLREALPHATVFTHLEPAEDPLSFADVGLERTTPTARS
jgi:cation diffusion facilitator family transporter